MKALSFMTEYIGEMSKVRGMRRGGFGNFKIKITLMKIRKLQDYIFAIAPLLEDALMDRDNVHRQTAMTVVKHIALGVANLGCEDALVHLLNHVFPNVFEQSPHVLNAAMDALEGLMVGLGPNVILAYILQGLFHPARKVREVYWSVYNMLYIYASHAMVAGYPAIESDERNNYERTTLELFI